MRVAVRLTNLTHLEERLEGRSKVDPDSSDDWKRAQTTKVEKCQLCLSFCKQSYGYGARISEIEGMSVGTSNDFSALSKGRCDVDGNRGRV